MLTLCKNRTCLDSIYILPDYDKHSSAVFSFVRAHFRQWIFYVSDSSNILSYRYQHHRSLIHAECILLQMFLLADMCYLSMETGPCRGRFRRWFYNKDHCQQFICGGCGGNKNNFPDQATCLRKCRCPRLTCDKECEYGPVFDKSGCPTCECLGNPCAVSMSQRCDRILKHKLYACRNQAQ